MNGVDIAILIVIGVSTLVGILRGFAHSIASLAIWILMSFVTLKNYNTILSFISGHISSHYGQYAALIVGFFVLTFLLHWFASKLVAAIVKAVGLGLVDRFLGFLFGFTRGLIFSSLLLTVVSYTPFSEAQVVADSQIAPQLAPITNWMKSFAADQVVSMDSQVMDYFQSTD